MYIDFSLFDRVHLLGDSAMRPIAASRLIRSDPTFQMKGECPWISVISAI